MSRCRNVWCVACLVLVALVGLVACPSVQAETPFTALVNQVSPDANVLVLIDSEQIRRSTFGKQMAADGAQTSSHVVSRGEISQVLMAAKIRGFRDSMVDWQTAWLQMNVEPSVEGLAANYKGSIDTMGKTAYAVLPYGAIAVPVGRKTLAVLTPPDRQQVSRVLRQIASARPQPLADYLHHAVSQIGGVTGAVIAIDLEGMFSANQLQGRLSNSDTFKASPELVSNAAMFLSSARGMTLKVAFRDTATATLTVDFSQKTPDALPWGKSLLSEALTNNGAYFSDIDGWNFTQHEKSIALEGPISAAGIRQVMSLLDFPTEVPAEYQPGAVLTSEQQHQLTAKASLARFRATEGLLADLRKDDRARTSRLGESALWFDRYARKIETLPSLNVDQDLMDYCDEVVLQLRIQATYYRMASSRVSQESTQPNVFWGYFTNYYGETYSHWTRTESDASRARRYERAASAGNRAEQFQAIDTATTDIRRKMTDRYKVEF